MELCADQIDYKKIYSSRPLQIASSSEKPRAPIATLSIHLCCRLVASAQFVTMLPASVLRFSNSDQSLKVPIKLPVQRRPVGVGTLKMARAARQQDFSLSAFTELQ
jgi:hypothetical protein